MRPPSASERHEPLGPRVVSRSIGDELEEAAVWIAEVHAGSLALRAEPRDRAGLELYTLPLEMCNCLFDWTGPDETEITVARLHRKPGYVVREIDARAVDVQLRVAEPVRDAVALAVRDELRSDDVAIKPIRDFPVGNGDNAVVESNRRGHVSTVTGSTSTRIVSVAGETSGRQAVTSGSRGTRRSLGVAVTSLPGSHGAATCAQSA
jgi:hypothetical protein